MRISRPSRNEPKSFMASQAVQWALAIFAALWLFAVIKVFWLDEQRARNNLILGVGDISADTSSGLVTNSARNMLKTTSIQRSSNNAENQQKLSYKSNIDKSPESNSGSADNSVVPPIPIKASDWLYVRSLDNSGFGENTKGSKTAPQPPVENAKSNIIDNASMGKGVVVSKMLGSAGTKKPTEFVWPAVKEDGSIPEDEGYDVMPLTELKVPKFWEPEPGVDLNKVGKLVNGKETIFLMLASYRDFQCRETITSAFNKADHPERLFIAAVDQIVPGDIGCLDIEIPCSENPDQPICKYRSQIAVYKMDAQYATGPVTARHIGDRMYRGEYFSMQLDAHCLFIRHWDSMIIDQWKQTKNEMGVLSTYLTDVQGSIDGNGDSTRHTRPIMCNSDFEGMMPARYLRHGSQPEDEPVIKDMPQLQPFWAAGFSFARGHFTVRVPYDGYQPMVFQGEEIAIGIRGFTHGYDFYAPRDSVVFHEYAERSNRRKKVHMFWENSQKHAGEGQKSLRRATAVIGMAHDIDSSSWDHSETDKYGLGKVRTLEQFYKLFLIDTYQRVTVQLCPFVKSGIMHRDFQKYLRPDGNGIDYSKLETYDTKGKIDEQLKRQIPEAERLLNLALKTRSKPDLDYALFLADRIGFEKINPELYNQARNLYSSM